MVWKKTGPEEAAAPSHPSDCQHPTRRTSPCRPVFSPLSLSISALYHPLSPLSPHKHTDLCIHTHKHTHPCGTVAEHCNFSMAAVFASHKSDTPLALLSLPPFLYPDSFPPSTLTPIHLSICTVCTSQAAVLKRIKSPSASVLLIHSQPACGSERMNLCSVSVEKCAQCVCVDKMCACQH